MSPFTAVGSGVLTEQIWRPDGTMLIKVAVTAYSVPLGEFTGQFLVMVPRNGPPIVVQAELQAHDGATVRLTITLTDMVSGSGDSNMNQVFHGGFTVTGGTSQFARPGAGTASARVDPSGMSFTFVLKGEMAVQSPGLIH
jgi:hypothetical protein